MELLHTLDADTGFTEVEVAAARLWDRYELEALDEQGQRVEEEKPLTSASPAAQLPPSRPPAPPLPQPWRCIVHRPVERECYRRVRSVPAVGSSLVPLPDAERNSCAPLPAPGEAADWVLRGASAVSRSDDDTLTDAPQATQAASSWARSCYEWQSASGDGLPPELGAMVSARDSSSLRKAHFLELCWHWLYASPYWRSRNVPREARVVPASRFRPPSERARPAALSAAGSPFPLSRPPPSLMTVLRRALMHDVSAFATVDPSFTLPAAIAAEPLAPVAVLVPDVMRGIMQMHRARAARAIADAYSLLAASATAAYDYCTGDETAAAEHHLALLNHNTIANQAAVQAIPAAALARMCGPDRAVIHDVHWALKPLVALVFRTTSELAGVRQTRDASRAEVLAAAASVCAAVAEMNLLIERRMRERIECVERGARRDLRAQPPSPYTLTLVDEFTRLGFHAQVQGDDPFFAQMRAATNGSTR